MFHWSPESVPHPWSFKTVLKNFVHVYRGLIFEILSDYFRNWFQYKKTDNDRTGKLQINNGVPPQSITGPFLFSVFVIDLPRYFEYTSKNAIFSDDISFVNAVPRNQCNLQTDSDWTNNWFSRNKLSIVILKCEVMNFGIGKPKPMALINNKIPRRNARQNLETYLDKKLFFVIVLTMWSRKWKKFSAWIYKGSEINLEKC